MLTHLSSVAIPSARSAPRRSRAPGSSSPGKSSKSKSSLGKSSLGKSSLGKSSLGKPLFIGIDVSKSWVDMADSQGRKKKVANTLSALAGAFQGRWLLCEHMVCEATGGYERALMQVAREFALPLSRVHTTRAHAFAKVTMRLAKSDEIDAEILTRYAAFTADEPRYPLPSAQTLELSDMVSRLIQLTDLRQAESCRAQQAHTSQIKASIKVMLLAVEAQISAMQDAIDAAIAKDPALSKNAALLRSCKGIGPKSAQAILAMLPEIGTVNRRKIAALVGVAPITKKSGSSVNHAKIEGGRKALRDILFMAALSASAHNPAFKTYYQRLRTNGKPHKLALVAVMRKLVITLNAIIKSQNPYKKP